MNYFGSFPRHNIPKSGFTISGSLPNLSGHSIPGTRGGRTDAYRGGGLHWVVGTDGGMKTALEVAAVIGVATSSDSQPFFTVR